MSFRVHLRRVVLGFEKNRNNHTYLHLQEQDHRNLSPKDPSRLPDPSLRILSPRSSAWECVSRTRCHARQGQAPRRSTSYCCYRPSGLYALTPAWTEASGLRRSGDAQHEKKTSDSLWRGGWTDDYGW